jgi:hypothetical protein
MRKLFELPPPGQKELYMHLFDENGREIKMELRPEVEIRGFVAKSLWDRHERAKARANFLFQRLVAALGRLIEEMLHRKHDK